MSVMGGALVPEDTPGGGLTMVLELPVAGETTAIPDATTETSGTSGTTDTPTATTTQKEDA